ncbi:hypothetical protein V8E54_011300 [Elaphomyces granulatus]
MAHLALWKISDVTDPRKELPYALLVHFDRYGDPDTDCCPYCPSDPCRTAPPHDPACGAKDRKNDEETLRKTSAAGAAIMNCQRVRIDSVARTVDRSK